jgi:hypothetical protein
MAGTPLRTVILPRSPVTANTWSRTRVHVPLHREEQSHENFARSACPAVAFVSLGLSVEGPSWGVA